jgi:hypothetical protein
VDEEILKKLYVICEARREWGKSRQKIKQFFFGRDMIRDFQRSKNRKALVTIKKGVERRISYV